MSRGSKLVLVGDPAQIDNPYVDSRSNGLVYTRQRMRGQPFAAHVPLSERRAQRPGRSRRETAVSRLLAVGMLPGKISPIFFETAWEHSR
jgi:predicted ribonuclease YlaK